ncbi:hypothetical protein AB0465_18005 [Streptomyces griseoviridis]|uniref:hypothetical protein n=1 Tax=Streptomyces griseoviridis TaxID=45398 RepID=UPI003450783A
MANLNPRQFRQPAFRGFGDQAMRSYRSTPAPQPDPAPAPAPRSQGQQLSLFQADEVRNPQGPAAPTFNASQFRTAQHALPGMSNAAVRDQRVTPAPEPAQPAPAPARSNWSQPEISMLGPTPASSASPSAAGPNPTHWPGPTPAPAASAPSPARPPVTINRAAYQAAGQRFGAPPTVGPTPAAARPASAGPQPAAPARPNQPPAPTAPPSTAARPQMPAWAGRTARYGGLAVGLGARAFQSVNKVATDPARSGNPLYKTSQGWNKS